MPDLSIGKIIFEHKNNRSCNLSRTIVQLSSDYMELSLIEETDVRNRINKDERSYMIPSFGEYMELEHLFFELIHYSIREINNSNCDESRLDYILNNGVRKIYLINDKDGKPVPPWLDLLKFLQKKLGIYNLNVHKSNLKSGSNGSASGNSNARNDFKNKVLSIIENIGTDKEFTVDDIRDEIIKNIKGTLNRDDLKKLFDKIWRVLKKLIAEGTIVKINRSYYSL